MAIAGPQPLWGRSRSPSVLLRLFTPSAALLRPLPLALPAATRLPAEPLVRGASLEQDPAPPVGAHRQPLRIEVGIAHVVVGSLSDPTSQPAGGMDRTAGPAGSYPVWSRPGAFGEDHPGFDVAGDAAPVDLELVVEPVVEPLPVLVDVELTRGPIEQLDE